MELEKILKKEYRKTKTEQYQHLPIGCLQTITTEMASHIKATLGLETIGQIANYQPFIKCQQISELAKLDPHSEILEQMSIPIVDKTAKLSIKEVLKQPINNLLGLTEQETRLLSKDLGYSCIGELAQDSIFSQAQTLTELSLTAAWHQQQESANKKAQPRPTARHSPLWPLKIIAKKKKFFFLLTTAMTFSAAILMFLSYFREYEQRNDDTFFLLNLPDSSDASNQPAPPPAKAIDSHLRDLPDASSTEKSIEHPQEVMDNKPDQKRDIIRYTIQKGDTLAKISFRFYQSYQEWPRIYQANRQIISDPLQINPGDTIRIPKKE